MQHESLITLSFNSHGWLQQLEGSFLVNRYTLEGTFKNVTSEQKTLDLYRFTLTQFYDYHPAISSHYTGLKKITLGARTSQPLRCRMFPDTTIMLSHRACGDG